MRNLSLMSSRWLGIVSQRMHRRLTQDFTFFYCSSAMCKRNLFPPAFLLFQTKKIKTVVFLPWSICLHFWGCGQRMKPKPMSIWTKSKMPRAGATSAQARHPSLSFFRSIGIMTQKKKLRLPTTTIVKLSNFTTQSKAKSLKCNCASWHQRVASRHQAWPGKIFWSSRDSWILFWILFWMLFWGFLLPFLWDCFLMFFEFLGVLTSSHSFLQLEFVRSYPPWDSLAFCSCIASSWY